MIQDMHRHIMTGLENMQTVPLIILQGTKKESLLLINLTV